MVNEYWLLTPGYDPQCQWKGRVMGVYPLLTQIKIKNKKNLPHPNKNKKFTRKKNNKRWRGILVLTSMF